jgi:hypothetical protein
MNVSTAPDDGVVQIAIASIRRDGGTQPRAAINHQTVTEYASDMKEGAIFPPVIVFYDGSDYWLADGFHRVEAAWSVGLTKIAASVRQGTIRDAVLYSVGVNATHGLRRSNADKRRAVTTLLEDSEWRQWSNREIARKCAVSLDLVNRLRISLNDSFSDNGQRTYITKHGTTAQMKTTSIGKMKKEEDLVELHSAGDATVAPNDQAIKASNENQTIESLVEGDLVIVKESNSLLASQTGIVTALPNPSAAIVELDGGGRELIYRKDLEKPFSPTPVQKTQTELRIRREGINYQSNGGSEYYVRVSERMWKRLEEYQHLCGAATMEGAIERLLGDAIAIRLS